MPQHQREGEQHTLTPATGGVAGINVTPLIDVLLVLLLIGLVSFSLSRRTLPVSLPQLSPVPVPYPQIVLELPDAGGFRLNGQPVPGEQLAAQLVSIYASRPVKLLFVKSGPERSYQDLIEAADLARGAGVTTVALVGNHN